MDWLIWLILILAPAALSGFIVYRVLSPRLKATQEYDEKIYHENQELKTKNQELILEHNTLLNENSNLHSQNDRLTIQKESALEQLNSINGSIVAMERQAQEAADLFYSSKMQIAQEKLEQSLMEENQKYQDNIINFQTEYDKTVADLLEAYHSLSNNVAVMRATNDAAVAAAKRAEEMKNQQAYYCIQLTPADIHEIELLRQVEPYLRDKEPLNKVIWKCYYEKPTTDLIGRVIGSGTKTGIYKITEIATGKCYVGQAVKIGR